MTVQGDDREGAFFSAQKAGESRRLYIDFDLYTEGDQEYKKELGLCLISNLRELQESLHAARQQNSPTLFLEACHKMKVTLSMLDDKEFDRIIAALQKHIVNADPGHRFTSLSKEFTEICDSIITGLTIEINHAQRNGEGEGHV